MAEVKRSASIEKVEEPEHHERRLGQQVMERQAALNAAIEADPGPGHFSLVAIQLYLIALVVCFCSGDNGFDGTVMGGINTMSQFQAFFGMKDDAAKTSIVFGIYTIDWLCDDPRPIRATAYLPDKYGRRFPMWIGNAILILGACMTANAKSMNMFLVGRWLTGTGCSCAGAAAKSYLAEISPAKYRGAYIGFLNSFYYIGQMAASGMMVSTGNYASDYSWRLPLYIQVVPAALNFFFVYFCPESPRWLHSVGRGHEARRILAKYHSATGDPNSPLIDLEMKEIEEKIEIDGQDKRWWDFRPLFATRADRYRAYMVILIGLSGNGMITYFLPVLLENAGIESQSKRLTLNFVNSVTSYIGAFTVDRFGRRRVLLAGTIAITVILAIVTGLLSKDDGNSARANAGIALVYLFMVVFSYGWTSMQALYPAEVLGYQARAKGLAFLNICTQGSTLINTFGLPVALEKIKWKTYLIFTIWDAFECAVIYFFVVETKGLTLEEITEVFEQ
ncbi:general substrate transporter [Desarmillaria tabescens]|uniref:General substrate transporter n=1 Tax=Armillaria tabescens TaxID=1929756 RepID=A0AA39U0L1_ARMTA|nr:general substrate transporter [Desarmillaria tabescens]KAK0464610.1 general substrate transporter [Desarmillaria tabescens]